MSGLGMTLEEFKQRLPDVYEDLKTRCPSWDVSCLYTKSREEILSCEARRHTGKCPHDPPQEVPA